MNSQKTGNSVRRGSSDSSHLGLEDQAELGLIRLGHFILLTLSTKTEATQRSFGS